MGATPSLPDASAPGNDAAERLCRLVAGPEQDIDLAEAALLIATQHYPDLDVAAYQARIDDLARGLGNRIPQEADTTRRIAALNQYLFDELGFAANDENYYDPRNSFLNDVIERRRGIPITLSLLYIEIGNRIGLRLHGVNFPGHFLVKCMLPEGAIVLDPYSGGISLGMAELQKRLRETQGGEVSRAIVAGLLVAAGKKDIILRMLRNLKAIYLREHKLEPALAVMNWIVATTPSQALELRDRGMIYQELECFRAALADFERYLALAPQGEDHGDIRERMVELRNRASRLN